MTTLGRKGKGKQPRPTVHRDLQQEAKALGLSAAGSTLAIQDRISAYIAEDMDNRVEASEEEEAQRPTPVNPSMTTTLQTAPPALPVDGSHGGIVNGFDGLWASSRFIRLVTTGFAFALVLLALHFLGAVLGR